MPSSTQRFEQWKWGIDLAIKITFPILLGAAGYTFTQLTDHDRRIYVLEKTTYTKDDAAEAFGEIKSSLSDIKVAQARLETKLENR